MENYIAIVKSTGGVLDKYQDFAVEADAINHVEQYGGFCCPNPGGSTSYWVVDEAAQTVTNNQAQADADALERSWNRLRMKRDSLLASTDWTQAADSPLTDEVKATWATYRQELRDLPETHASDPDAVVWPTPPE
jgi:hypothetical protein